jgi:hypothetical protein
MGVNFYDGSDGISNKTNQNYIRCVRGDFLDDISFSRSENETVVDNTNSLEWQDNADIKNQSFTYSEAFSYCNALSLAGTNNWRLPTINELRSIVDLDRSSPAIDINFNNSVNGFFWSTTSYAPDTEKVWSVFFTDGNDYQQSKTNKAYTRCVKDN